MVLRPLPLSPRRRAEREKREKSKCESCFVVGVFVGPILCSKWSMHFAVTTPLGRFDTA